MSSGSCQAVVWRVIHLSGSHQAVVGKSPGRRQGVAGSHQTVIRHLLGSCQAVIRQSSGSHQAVVTKSSVSLIFTHSSFQRLTLTPRTLLPVWLSYCVHGKFSEYGFGLKHHFQSYCLMLGNSIRYSTRSLKTTTFFSILKIFY